MTPRTLILLPLLLLGACSGDKEPAAGPPDAAGRDVAEAAEPEALESLEDMRAGVADFGPREEMPGAALYAEHCAICHDGTVPKAPHLHWLEMMSPHVIVEAMTDGIMSSQAAALDEADRRHVAEFITLQSAQGEASALAYAPACTDDGAAFDLDRPPAKVGWGHDTSRFVPGDVAGLSALEVPDLELKWAYAYPGALRARSQPSVAYGALYVGSYDGSVYALDLETGCARWRFQASGEVRTGVVIAEQGDGEPPLAVFGDLVAKLYAVNALTGEEVWSLRADEHPSATMTGTPAVFDGTVYAPVSSLEVIPAADPAYECCTFRGSLLAVELGSGATVWRHYTIPEVPSEVSRTSAGTRVLAPSGAPSWTSPAIDRKRNLVYIGTGENYSSPADGNSDAILAIDRKTGERVWQRQSTSGDAWNVACMMADNPNCPEEDGPDFDHGSSMILIELPNGSDVLTVGHKNGTIFGLDPDNEGAVLWQTRVGRGSIQGGVHFGMAADGTTLYAPINDMNNTYDGSVLDASKARPGVHAIDATNGEVLWSHVQEDVCPEDLPYCDPGISAAITAMPGAVFAGHLDGFVRAYDRDSGKVIWEFDTKQAVMAVNGITAKGGGMSGAGPAIADGHVIVNSGYGLYFHEPGNMLAVFAVPND